MAGRNHQISVHQGWRILIAPARAILLTIIFSPVLAASAEEARVFTDNDLPDYSAEKMVDQETLTRLDQDLDLYRKDREKQRARESRQEELQKKREALASSRKPVVRQGGGNRSGIAGISQNNAALLGTRRS